MIAESDPAVASSGCFAPEMKNEEIAGYENGVKAKNEKNGGWDQMLSLEILHGVA